MKKVNFFELKGQTLIGIIPDKYEFRFVTDRGVYISQHNQDCCENVRLQKFSYRNTDLNKDVCLYKDDDNFLYYYFETFAPEDGEIILAEEDHPDLPAPKMDCLESFTWTRYRIKIKHFDFEILFLGTSNGYYGETMEFYQLAEGKLKGCNQE